MIIVQALNSVYLFPRGIDLIETRVFQASPPKVAMFVPNDHLTLGFGIKEFTKVVVGSQAK